MPRSALLALLLLTACSRWDEARPIAYGETACAYCHMTVLSAEHAAQLVPVSGAVQDFDEAGCLLRYAAGKPLADGDRLWVHDEATGSWIDARRAFYAVPRRPRAGMMYGVTAWAERFEAARDSTARVLSYDEALAELGS